MLSGARWKPDPARRENPEYVSVRKQSDIALNGANAGNHSVRPCTDLLGCFSARAAVAENHPAGPFLVDLLGRQTLVLTIVPFDEVGVDDGCVGENRQFRYRSKVYPLCPYDGRLSSTPSRRV